MDEISKAQIMVFKAYFEMMGWFTLIVFLLGMLLGIYLGKWLVF